MKNLREKIKNCLLENEETLFEIIAELNGWNGCLDYLDYWSNDEEFFEVFFEGRVMEAVRATCYGEYNFNDDYVKIDVYGNLQSCNKWERIEEIKDNIEEVIDNLIEYKNCINIDDEELEKLLNEEEEEEE